MMSDQKVQELKRRYGVKPTATILETDLIKALVELHAENKRLRKRISGLEAARIAYASEFPADSDGNPDVGSIHQNIRRLQGDAERYRFLRIDDNWGEDGGRHSWENLGHSSGEAFDEIVDRRMKGEGVDES